MPASIRIKRSITNATPASLLEGELAYSEVSNNLFIGANGGADVVTIGGSGTYLKTAQLLTEILAIDGPGSGINADLLDGFNTATGTTATTIPVRDASGLLPGGITGNAATATKWATGRTVSLTGDATGTSGTLDGTANVSISVTLANSGVTADTYPKVTVNSKGLVTGGASLIASDIPTLTAAKISDFDTQVRTNRLDQMSAPQLDVGWNSRKITGLLDPTNAQDAATKAYVDAADTAGEVMAGAGLTKSGSTLDVGGTADRISVSADAVDIASTYVGQTSITTLGTITTGTWDGGTF